MNEEKLRIAIAEALGYSKWGHIWILYKRTYSFDELPNYLTSRDAAIEAVIELCNTKDKQEFFLMYLFRFAEKPENFSVITATASQICQALAKALNLNVEE